MTVTTRKTFEVDGNTCIIVEYDAQAFRLIGKDGSVTIPMRMLHLIVETMEMAMEAAGSDNVEAAGSDSVVADHILDDDRDWSL
jgi:cyanophycinase-like exopeptidase